MRTQVSIDDIAPALSRAARVVDGRATIPILDTVKFLAGPEGLSATTCNLDSCFTTVVDIAPRDPWSGCVNAERFAAFAQSLPPGSSIELVEKLAEKRAELAAYVAQLTIASSGATAQLPVFSADDFPQYLPAREEIVSFAVDGGALAGAIKAVEPCIDEQKSARYYLEGAFIDPAGLLVATDGNRLAVHRFAAAASLPEIPPNAIVPRPTLHFLTSVLRGFSEDVTIALASGTVTFRCDSWSLTSKLIDGTFPDWRRLVPDRDTEPIVVETTALKRAVGRVNALCRDEKTRGLRLQLYGSELSVSAASPDACVDTIISAEGGRDPAQIGLRTKYLDAALDAVTGSERVEIHLGDGPVRVCAVGEAENATVIMPMRF